MSRFLHGDGKASDRLAHIVNIQTALHAHSGSRQHKLCQRLTNHVDAHSRTVDQSDQSEYIKISEGSVLSQHQGIAGHHDGQDHQHKQDIAALEF